MIWRSTIREIKNTFGRYLAILAIVALGVGFFAGLKVTKQAMVETTGAYLERLDFYDYRLLSTMGFELEDVEFLLQKEDVKFAEGAVNFDIIYREGDGEEGVIKAHSITEHINQLKLVAGRMPLEDDECVVDSNLFGEEYLGKKLMLSENNEEEDREHFQYDQYTIVGIVQSPLYIQFERGNTSLGSGKIDGFVYMPTGGFSVDYYTEIFVKFVSAFPLYSEAYDAFIEGKEGLWEQYCEEAADLRYQRILQEAWEEVEDAERELAEKKEEADREFADARKELDDAKAQIEDGEKQLADAREEIRKGKNTIAAKTKELADGEQELLQKEQELAENERTLEENQAALNSAKDALQRGKDQLAEGRRALEEQKRALKLREEELLAGEAALYAGISAEELEGYKQLAPNLPEEVLTALETQRQLAEGKEALETGKATIAAYEEELDQNGDRLAQASEQIRKAEEQLTNGRGALEEGKTALEDAKGQLEEGRIQLEKAQRELANGQKELEENEKELEDRKADYEEGLAEYEEQYQEYETEVADAEEKIADAKREIEDIKSPDSYLLGRDTNVGYVCFENDSSIVEGIANVFPVFFFLVAALVCITTMNRMVEEQRTQIGVLKALGYREHRILFKYMFYSGSAAVIGCVLGYAGGTWAFPRVIWTAYGIMYRIESLVYVFDWKLALISLVVALICSVGTTWMSCHVEMGEAAAQLMRPKAPGAGKRIFLEYLPFVWKRLSFLKKVSIRNIFRYKKRLFMMVLGISGCTALLVTGFGIKDSIAGIASAQFEEIQIYDVNVTLSHGVTSQNEEQIAKKAQLAKEQYIYGFETTFDLVTAKARKAVTLLVLDDEKETEQFLNLHTDKGEEIAYPKEGEGVITDKFAEEYGIRPGDTITLQNEEMDTISVIVVGISENFIYNYVYINQETYNSQMGKAVEYKNIYLNLSEGQDAHLTAAALMNCDDVTNVTVNRDVMERFAGMMKSLDLIVIFVISCAAGLAFIVLYNLTNINITERIREIATIKVLGFRRKETASYVFRENMVLAAMGTAVGLVLGKLLHQFVMSQIRIDLISFDVRIALLSYIYSVILTFLFAWAIHLLMGGKLDRISMTESLKSVD